MMVETQEAIITLSDSDRGHKGRQRPATLNLTMHTEEKTDISISPGSCSRRPISLYLSISRPGPAGDQC